MSGQIPLDFRMQVSGDSEVRAKFDRTGDVIEETGNRTEQSAKKADSAFNSYSKAAGSFSLAASGVTSLYFSYDNLEKGQLRVDKAQAAVTSSQASLASAQNTLNNLVDKGITSGPQYEAALLRLQSAQQQLTNNVQAANIAQGDLSQSQLQFALGVVPGVFSAVTGLREGITALKDAQVFSRIATALGIPVSLADGGAKTAQAGVTAGATLATKGLTLATKLLHLAMGPVGIAILGISTFLTLFATNAFGVRDSINAMGKAIGDAIPILRPLLDTLAGIANAIFPQTEDSAGEMTEGITSNFGELAYTSNNKTLEVNTDMAGLAQQLQVTSIDAGSAITALAEDTEHAADDIVRAANRAKKAMASIGISKGESSSSIPSRGQVGTFNGKAVSINAGGAITLAANGFDGIVDSPRLFLAGEAGPEHVSITPTGGSSGGAKSIEITVVSELDGIEIARTVNKLMAREFT